MTKKALRDQMSVDEIRKDLVREALASPYLIYPACGATASMVVAGIVGAGGSSLLVAMGVAAAGLLTSGITYARAYLQRDKRVLDRMVALQHAMAREIQAKQSALRKRLEDLDVAAACAQMDALRTSFTSLNQLLKQRFNDGEMTYVKYVGTAEQVYLGALDNLRTIAEFSERLQATDKGALALQINAAEKAGNTNSHSALNERMDIVERAEAQIARALTENETAITRILQVEEALITLNTGQKLAGDPLAQAMDELRRLAERTPEYGTRR